MNHLQTLKEWWRFTRNGAIFGLLVALFFFWGSSHSADEIAVSIAIPLILFNCMPLILTVIARLISAILPPPRQESLPLDSPPVDIKTLPAKQRVKAYLLVWTVIAMILCFFGSLALLAASYAYPTFDIAWAAHPARILSVVLFAISVVPIVATLSFVAGMSYTGKIRDSAVAIWIYLRTIHPLRHWPTTA